MDSSKVILTVLLFCAFVQGFSAYKYAHLRPLPRGKRVVGGSPAVNGQFPHMVYLDMGCGGSLISDKWLLTVAHCIGYMPTAVAYMGDVNHNISPVSRNVISFYVHPGWNVSNLNNDIALLELEYPVEISDNVRPINIPSTSEELFVGEEATLAGFGYLDDNAQQGSNILYHVDLGVIGNDECAEYFGTFIVNSTICGVGIQNPSDGSCYDDSGSGLVLKRSDGDVLIGISSFLGWDGCYGHNPSGFVRPNFYLDWIRQTTGLEF